MVDPELDPVREVYKQVTDEWVVNIRAKNSWLRPTTLWRPWNSREGGYKSTDEIARDSLFGTKKGATLDSGPFFPAFENRPLRV
jgi:hypothetical protein